MLRDFGRVNNKKYTRRFACVNPDMDGKLKTNNNEPEKVFGIQLGDCYGLMVYCL
jgi:hypothetical protein